MGTVFFNPCYSAPSFSSTSIQFRKQPKLGAPIFFLKGIADGPRMALPHLKVLCKILDGKNRLPKKMSARNKTLQVADPKALYALVKQAGTSLRNEKLDKKASEEAISSLNKRKSESGPSEEKPPAAAFLDYHLLRKKQALAEKGNGALTKLLQTRNRKIVKKSEPVADLKKSEPVGDLKKSEPVVDLKLTRPRSKFMKRSPIPRPPFKEEKVKEVLVSKAKAEAVVVAAKAEEPELIPVKEEKFEEVLVSEVKAEAVVVVAKAEEPELVTLDEMMVSELKLLAKTKGLKGYYKMKKSELVAMLKSQE